MRNILAICSGVISCDGRMLDDAEILVVLEFEPGIKERVVELFG